ncbi:hypothetical protein N7535_002330 [Penicillium sp. DV-2018c]|nr:hypothetical protein N7535_002330 [Penicillium sp. DV-2018c]
MPKAYRTKDMTRRHDIGHTALTYAITTPVIVLGTLIRAERDFVAGTTVTLQRCMQAPIRQQTMPLVQ